MDNTKEISKKVNALIEKNNDADKGYQKAAKNAEHKDLVTFLSHQANERKTFALELTSGLKSYNPEFDVDTDGSATGAMHRTWMDVKAALSMDDDESLLEECIRGDKASKEEYEEFLEDYPALSADLRSTVQNQLTKINATLNRVKRLEDLN